MISVRRCGEIIKRCSLCELNMAVLQWAFFLRELFQSENQMRLGYFWLVSCVSPTVFRPQDRLTHEFSGTKLAPMASNSSSLNMRAGLRSTLTTYPCSINDLAAVGVTIDLSLVTALNLSDEFCDLHADRYSRGLHSDRRWMVVCCAIETATERWEAENDPQTQLTAN